MIKRIHIRLFPVILAAAAFLAGCAGDKSPGGQSDQPLVRIGAHGVLHRAVDQKAEEPTAPSPAEMKKKEIAERLDRAGLLSTGKVVTDRDPRMLEPPRDAVPPAGKKYEVAKEPPEIEFCIVPVKPPWLGESPVKASKDVSNYKGPWRLSEITNVPGPWTHWTQGAYDARTGRFYTSAGDHGKYGGRLHIVEYDPAAKTVRCLPEINRALGRTDRMFGDGKLHGWLDFYKSRDIDREHLWFITYWTKYPEPDEEDYATGYEGGHIVSQDVATGDMVDYGAPFKRVSFPYHRVDTKRGIMYGVGMYGEFFAWDINEQKTLWAGYLPEGMTWWNRAIMIDEATGFVYTTNAHASDKECHFIRYDPVKNRFFLLGCHVPPESGEAVRSPGKGKFGNMRCQTRHRSPDGLFWGITLGGQLFSFDPEKETVVDRGECWFNPHRYTTSMEQSPKGRYLYYIPCAPRFHLASSSPVVQYDTVTGTKKVLAFLYPFYREKYGFTTGQNFSLKLDDAGGRLFAVWNGGFVEHAKDGSDDTFGQVAVMLIHIPESERKE